MFGRRVLPLYQELALRYGFDNRIAAWRALESDAPYGDGDQRGVDRLVVEAALDMVERDSCEVVVLAGAVMAGVPARLQSQVPVPLVEGVSCAVAQSELLVHLGFPKGAVGSLAALPQRSTVGLSPALAARFGSGAHAG
jgi:allantoin racemase